MKTANIIELHSIIIFIYADASTPPFCFAAADATAKQFDIQGHNVIFSYD